MHKLSLAALLLLNSILAFAQYTPYVPSSVPNNKLVNNSYVSNPDAIISDIVVAEIDSALTNLEKQTTAQVSVVVLGSIGDADIFDFAQELFNLWGIGRSNDNGLLILLVEDKHTVRFHTGRQLEGALPDAVCKQIQRDQMVPLFKEGDYNTGMLNGVSEVVKILTDPNYAAEIAATEDEYTIGNYTAFMMLMLMFFAPAFLIAWGIKSNRFADSKSPAATNYPQMRLRKWTWLIEFGGVPSLIIFLFWFGDPETSGGLMFLTLYFYFMATIFHRMVREQRMIKDLMKNRKYFEVTDYFRRSTWYWLSMALIFPVPFLGYFPFHFMRWKFYRHHPRKCALCEGSMKQLSEKDDDQFLTKAQLIEETIESVNYDVWQCQECSATEAWHFVKQWSGYVPCTKCGARAWYIAHNKTLKAATYSSQGKGESFYQCKACGRSERKPYTIATLTRSSSSSSSGSSFSSSSSSSSSGGSWGGGRSGGGGASSSW